MPRFPRTHPYQKSDFWRKNPFWETDMYSEKSKEFFRNWVQSMTDGEKKLNRLEN